MYERDVVRRVGTNGNLDASPPVRLARRHSSPPSVDRLGSDGFELTAARVAAAVHGALQRPDAGTLASSEGRVRASSQGSAGSVPAVTGGRVRPAGDIIRRQRTGVHARLGQHLVDTGRANQVGGRARPRLNQLGGARSTAADEKAESYAGKILAGLESGTRENQLATNPSAITTHAVSGHGPGTDQESRLLHGRRNDQLVAERAANNGVAPGPRTTVGDDPSNTSGAFTTARGMLHAVTEGFAQANMFSGHADTTARERGPGSSRVDEARFVTNVTGPGAGAELGYNLEVTGLHSQQKGAALAHDEIERRRAAITRTDGLTQARVVLDPAFVGGKRAGWNLQTAYANADAPTAPLDQPADAQGRMMTFEADVGARERDVASAKVRLGSAVDDKQRHLGTIAQKRQNIERLESLVAGRPVPPESPTIDEMRAELQRLRSALGDLDDAGGGGFSLFGDPDDVAPVDEAEAERIEADRAALAMQIARLEPQYDTAVSLRQLADSRAELSELERATLEKDRLITVAQQGVTSAEAMAAQAARTLTEQRTAERARRPVGGSARPPRIEGKSAAGYDPATGTYTGDRPSKLGSQLRGTDEEGDALTAHHLYPWNKIKEDLNTALSSNDRVAMEKLFAFGDVEVGDWFWDELRKPSAQRPYAFSEEVNAAVQKICWAPRNVFMGPLNTKRGDDPGEGLDRAFTRSGLPTTPSAAAELIAATGGILGSTPETIERDITGRFLAAAKVASVADLDEARSRELAAQVSLAQGKRRLAELVLQRTREARGSETRPYERDEWRTDHEGKRVRAGRVADDVHARSLEAAELDAFVRRLTKVAEDTSARVRKEADAIAAAIRAEARPPQ